MDEFLELLKAELKDAGRELTVDLDEVKVYAAEQAAKLSAVVGQPGFPDAVRAARDNVALKAGLQSVESADRIDQRIIGMIQAALGILAKAA